VPEDARAQHGNVGRHRHSASLCPLSKYQSVTVPDADADADSCSPLTAVRFCVSRHRIGQSHLGAGENAVSARCSSQQARAEYDSREIDRIIDRLVKVPDLRVPARTSSFYFKGKSLNVADIALELGVANVLEGSVRTSGKRVRVIAQLVRAGDGYQVWSQSYDRELRGIFEVQDEIATAIATAREGRASAACGCRP